MEDLRGLRVLVVVAQCGSFTAAARELGLSTAAVSKTVARYERELGSRLFNRTTRRLSVTTAGQRFIEQLNVSLAGLARGADELREAATEPAGLVRVCTHSAIGRALVVPALQEFLAAHPRVTVELHFDDRRRDLLKEGFDFGIRHGNPVDKGFVSQPLGKMPLALVASPVYLAQRGEPQRPEDLRQHTCISVRTQDGRPSEWLFEPLAKGPRKHRIRIEPRGSLIVAEQYDAVVDAALAGMGVTVMFFHAMFKQLKSGELRLLLPNWRVLADAVEDNSLYLSYPQDRYQTFAARRLIEFLMPRLSLANSIPRV
jgi:DNA-binding transcriptional LysR family regulator